MDKKSFRLKPICQALAMIALLAESQGLLAAANFKITPAGNLPNSVPAGGSVIANYTVTNQTRNTRSNYRVVGLPNTVTQDGSNPNCSNPIYLLPKQSCNLAFTVTGAVNSKFALCNGGSCTTSPEPLVVTVSNAINALPMIAVGTYNGSNLAFYPLLVRYDGLLSYPETIISNLPTNPTYVQPDLYAASCSGTLCMAVGGDDNNTSNPLIAFSSDAGSNWTYPIGSTGSWPQDIANNNPGRFSSASCMGNICIAGGNYTDSNSAFPHPLLAQYANNNWSYPITALNPPPDFNLQGAFNAVSCSDLICIATGTYSNGSSLYPLLAQSVDQGTTWNYAIDDTTTLPSNFFQIGAFYSASCYENRCIAGGAYEDTIDAKYDPLLAQSTNRGLTWNYVIDAITGPQLPLVISPNNQFNSTSCSASICIAAGTYSSGVGQAPMLAQSTDGFTWNYIITGILNPPANMAGNAYFTSASCDGAFCVAAGYYTNNASQQIPMVAQTIDNGQNWTYGIDDIHGPNLADYTSNGQFNSSSCANNVCMAVGSYMVGQVTYPMYAQSSNGGGSWTYIVNDNPTTLPSNYNNYGIFRGAAADSPSPTLDSNGYTYESLKKELNKK